MNIELSKTRSTPSSFLERYQLTIFFVLVMAASITVSTIGYMQKNENLAMLAILSPSITAIILTALLSGRSGLRDLLVKQLVRPVAWRWVLVAAFLIPTVAALAIYLHSLFGGPQLVFEFGIPQAIFIVLISVGEEFGWRAFALPRLQTKHSALTASLILGIIWGAWHFPPAYLLNTAAPSGMPFGVFMIWVVTATILITWVYNNSKSVLMAIVMHSTANAAFGFLPLLPEWVGQMTTFWVFLGLLVLITIAVVMFFGPARLTRNA